jgi:tetratricopeptide (TPR) repeat protein
MDIENAAKLKTFKDRVQTDNIVNFFKSSADLRAHAINSLSQYRESDITQFHYVSNIPQPPEAYIAHPYTLLQTHRLIGRQKELNLLTNWVTKKQEEIYWTRIMNIVAIGGMGKSALTWKWFNDIAPQEIKPLAGQMWWSFYESDATFENFVIRALAYISKRSREDIEKNTKPGEREEQLLQILDREPYLLVLDGLERILIAYARMDAARLSDDDIDQRTANFVTKVYGLPESVAQSFVGQHQLRKTCDPRTGSFLRKLANARSARILVSTRLYPADLQSVAGEPVEGCSAIFLPGLNDDDALNLWRAFNVSGSHESLLPLFNKFENHPLLMQSLASEVGSYRRAPGDFERWQKDHPHFNPFSLPMTQVKGHVLGFAMQGLYKNVRKVLETIAGFRMPAHYDTLAAIFVGDGKTFPTELGLDQALKELEDRGLLGWDKRANRYDLHPIVRGVVWSRLTDDTRNGVFTSLQAHFESMPKISTDDIKSIDDLTSTIELYNTLIGLGRYDDAFELMGEPLAPLIRFGASRQLSELLELLFPSALVLSPFLEKQEQHYFLLGVLGLSYRYSGQPKRAISVLKKAILIAEQSNDNLALGTDMYLLAYLLYLSGMIFSSEATARNALKIARLQDEEFFSEVMSLHWLGLILSARGRSREALNCLSRAYKMGASEGGWIVAYLAQRALWLQNYDNAISLANRTWKLAHVHNNEVDLIQAAHLQGSAELGLNNYASGDERLHHALTRARSVNHVEEELPALIALAELRRRQKDSKAARELLDDALEYSERGPYPLFHADAFNLLAQIERDEGNRDKAIEAAIKAYRLAWCDGPPYAYHWGLEKAKQHLKELSAPEPKMPSFDESKFEPIPQVEINPKDEFWVDPDKEFDIDDLEK